jgi:hypothetical protein
VAGHKQWQDGPGRGLTSVDGTTTVELVPGAEVTVS